LARNDRPRPLQAILAVAVGLALGSASTATAAGTDQIWPKGAKNPIRATIVEESIEGIKTVSGATFSPLAIDKVIYADTPAAFREGLAHYQSGRYDEAIKYFESAMRLPNVRKFWLQPACLYYIGLCHLEGGTDLPKAEKAFNDLLSQWPKSRWLPNTLLALGRVHLANKAYQKAYAQFQKLADLAAKDSSWQEWLLRALLWQGRCLLEEKNYTRALAILRKVTTADPTRYGDLVIQAKTAEATVYVRRGDYDKGAALLEGLIREIGPRVAKEINTGSGDRMQLTEAQCYNALGHCYLKRATRTNKPDDYREALLAFLWTVVLHSQFPAEHAEALYHAAECFEKLKQNRRATELRNELAERYPDSPFTRKLQPAKKENAR